MVHRQILLNDVGEADAGLFEPHLDVIVEFVLIRLFKCPAWARERVARRFVCVLFAVLDVRCKGDLVRFIRPVDRGPAEPGGFVRRLDLAVQAVRVLLPAAVAERFHVIHDDPAVPDGMKFGRLRIDAVNRLDVVAACVLLEADVQWLVDVADPVAQEEKGLGALLIVVRSRQRRRVKGDSLQNAIVVTRVLGYDLG